MKRALALSLLFCLGASTALAQSPLSEREKESLRQFSKQYLKHQHWDAASVDVDAAIDAVDRYARKTTERRDIGRWMQEALMRSWWSFVPRDPNPQYEYLYGFPLDVGTPRVVLDAPEQGELAILAAKGTPIVAAREGRVARVIDGYTRCCLPKEEAFRTNQVLIQHKDGTVARYGRMRAGVRVKQGQVIERGDLLGFASDVGATKAPGLILALWASSGDGTKYLGMKFEGKDGEAMTLTTEAPLVDAPERQLRLFGFLDGEVVRRNAKPRKMKEGQSLRIRLRHRPRQGEPRDVTNSSKTRFDTPTPWLVELLGNRATFRRKAWPGAPAGDKAIVRGLYEDSETGKTGWVDLEFVLTD